MTCSGSTAASRAAPCARSRPPARVSLGYLSEVERGQKEASSELLGSICEALEVPLSEVLRDVSDNLALAEALAELPQVPVAAPTPLHVTNVAA